MEGEDGEKEDGDQNKEEEDTVSGQKKSWSANFSHKEPCQLLHSVGIISELRYTVGEKGASIMYLHLTTGNKISKTKIDHYKQLPAETQTTNSCLV